ncbi:MAG: HAD family hydrolase [Peptoniphilaceae bacterium]|nr:HAD family hydrolase [Peptoniphilaceae bacterium]MDY3076115.1 HAD family hydrolase [Peptoniphilaceae bacterium]
MIRLFCSDFDNTLARKRKIPEAHIEAIHRLQRAGVDFALVTGRAPQNACAILEKYSIRCHCIGFNGSAGVERDGRQIFEIPMDLDALRDLLADCRTHGEFFLLYGNGRCYIPKIFGFFSWIKGMISRKVNMRIEYLERDLSNFIHDGGTAYKLNRYPGRRMQDLKNALLKDDRISVTASSHRQMEVSAAGVSKWNGILSLSAVLGISPDEIAAIGDYENDLSMIRNAGIGFSMGNGSEELKAAADFIVGDVKNAGLAEAADIILRYNDHEEK